MSNETLTVVFAPLIWLAIVWFVNRAAFNQTRRTRWILFTLTSASPIIMLMSYITLEGIRLDIYYDDPKILPVLLSIGLPASLVAGAVAYWGSKGLKRKA